MYDEAHNLAPELTVLQRNCTQRPLFQENICSPEHDLLSLPYARHSSRGKLFKD